MLPRRRFLTAAAQTGAGLAVAPALFAQEAAKNAPILVNDIHAQLNPTYVSGIVQPKSLSDLQTAVQQAKQTGRAVSIAGGRHAMGAQQFGSDALLLDTRSMNK